MSYMGTKRQIAPLVADVISRGPNGPLLDLFSGICAVGSAIGPKRPIWSNDIQHFSDNVATAFFTSQQLPPTADTAADLAFPFYLKNKTALTDRFNVHLNEEKKALATKGITKIASLLETQPNVGLSSKLENERRRLARRPHTFPYRLFSITFAAGYLGLSQCMQVDSIRYATDQLLEHGRISSDIHRWMTLALCQAVCKVSTTTGHFAQFIKIKEGNKQRFINQRNRSVWREWLNSLESFVPVGSKRWRSQNKTFQEDAIILLDELSHGSECPSIVYADPPYTDDQYSRYYHLYETLLLYDYPTTSGIGRYRPNRFSSRFSLKTEVSEAFEQLIQGCARLSANLVLSYPQNGLLNNAKEAIISMLKKHYSVVEIAKSIDHLHSSLGASKGKEKYSVTEIIFWAR